MDRKQKIMRLIIDILAQCQQIKYEYTGAVTTIDPLIISLDFVAKTGNVRGDFNIRGMIDVPLALKAQFDTRSLLNDHPDVQREIEADLLGVSARINRIL